MRISSAGKAINGGYTKCRIERIYGFKGMDCYDNEIKAGAAQKRPTVSRPAYLLKMDGFVKFSYSDNAFNSY
jgi:hypothetical protein